MENQGVDMLAAWYSWFPVVSITSRDWRATNICTGTVIQWLTHKVDGVGLYRSTNLSLWVG